MTGIIKVNDDWNLKKSKIKIHLELVQAVRGVGDISVKTFVLLLQRRLKLKESFLLKIVTLSKE